ncbi:MAG: Gfo/Idh/MocA family oxidoreductase [Phycisphaerae bacterium]|nr:Gfo/Idh/MocA family oxidoreductase [Phycisphaerae bacterium]
MTKEGNVRIGFVGCGTHSTHNLYPMLKYAACELVATCDRDESLAQRNAAVYGAKAAYTDYRRMMDQETLDAVMVCGPFDLHYAAGCEAMSRGLPVWVEKPPAPDLASTLKMVEIANKNKTFFMIGFMKRFALTYRKVWEFAQNGRAKLSSGLFRYTHWAGMDLHITMMAMAVHPVDLAMSYFGVPSEVTSFVYDAAPKTPCVNLTLRFPDGRWATILLGCHGPRIQEHVELYGQMDGKDGYFAIDNVLNMELHTAGQGGVDIVAPTFAQIAPTFDMDDIKVWRPDLGIPNMAQCSTFAGGYAGEIREFVNAIREGRRATPSNEDVIPVMKVVDAVLKKPNGRTVL